MLLVAESGVAGVSDTKLDVTLNSELSINELETPTLLEVSSPGALLRECIVGRAVSEPVEAGSVGQADGLIVPFVKGYGVELAIKDLEEVTLP